MISKCVRWGQGTGKKGSHVRRSETLATHLSSEAEVKRGTAKDPRPRNEWQTEQSGQGDRQDRGWEQVTETTKGQDGPS